MSDATHTIGVDFRQNLVVDGDVLAGLTRYEALTLQAIISRNTVATKDYLLTALYGGVDEPEIKIVGVFVCKVRRKLGAHAAAIETVWGRGYVRGAGYEPMEAPSGAITVEIDAKSAEELSCARGKPIGDLVAGLVRADLARVWGSLSDA